MKRFAVMLMLGLLGMGYVYAQGPKGEQGVGTTIDGNGGDIDILTSVGYINIISSLGYITIGGGDEEMEIGVDSLDIEADSSLGLSSSGSVSLTGAGVTITTIDGFNATGLSFTTPTDLRSIVFPDASGTVALTSDITGPFPLTSNTTIANDDVETYWGTSGVGDFKQEWLGTGSVMEFRLLNTGGSLRFLDESGLAAMSMSNISNELRLGGLGTGSIIVPYSTGAPQIIFDSTFDQTLSGVNGGQAIDLVLPTGTSGAPATQGLFPRTQTSGGIDSASAVWGAANSIVFEGSTANTVETTLVATNPTTTDKTITLPDATGTVVLSTTTGVTLPSFTQAALPASANGSVLYCSDCNPDATCTGAGAGAFAFRIAGAWACELN